MPPSPESLTVGGALTNTGLSGKFSKNVVIRRLSTERARTKRELTVEVSVNTRNGIGKQNLSQQVDDLLN